ncbi:MAG: 3'-5' exonuclease [Rhodospirillales bacterium]|jgi:DNA polymerase III epsilon subunit-like protein|nr:3'-5' exonuclease [Rhodospirillales bacterium]
MTIADIFDRYLGQRLPPKRLRVPAHTPLERLPLVAIDCETTGLDARQDRIVSIAAVRIAAGLSVVEQPILDLLINPRITIPARAVAVHRIDNAQVAAAPTISDAFDEILAALAGCVVVGHHVGFDLAMLAGEARRNGRDWREPPCFDTFELLGGLGLAADNVDLVDILARLGLEPKGVRHNAAGDARMAADLFVALARKLIGQGRGTFGGAMAAHRAPRR